MRNLGDRFDRETLRGVEGLDSWGFAERVRKWCEEKEGRV
jgi:hypothetical protein